MMSIRLQPCRSLMGHYPSRPKLADRGDLHVRPLHTQAKGRDRVSVRALDSHPKVIVDTVCWNLCRV